MRVLDQVLDYFEVTPLKVARGPQEDFPTTHVSKRTPNDVGLAAMRSPPSKKWQDIALAARLRREPAKCYTSGAYHLDNVCKATSSRALRLCALERSSSAAALTIPEFRSVGQKSSTS